jgi:predicted RecB family nuclease
MLASKPVRANDPNKYRVTDLQMAKRPSLTKTLAEAAFYQAWFANTPESKQDPETYQRTFERYMKRFEKMPALALRTVARAASAEANRSIKAYEKLSPLPANIKAPIELSADPRTLAELVARYKAKLR